MKLLALDISSATGACWDGDTPERPKFVTHHDKLQDDDFGAMYVNLGGWLTRLIKLVEPDALVLEEPWVPSGSRGPSRPTDPKVPRMLLGLVAIAEAVAKQQHLECYEEGPRTVRKHFVGNGNAKKPEIKAQCLALGWTPKNNHEADAGALWHYTKCRLDPGFRSQVLLLPAKPKRAKPTPEECLGA